MLIWKKRISSCLATCLAEGLGDGITPIAPPINVIRSFGPFPAANGHPEASLSLSLSDLADRNGAGMWTIGVADGASIFSGSMEGGFMNFNCA